MSTQPDETLEEEVSVLPEAEMQASQPKAARTKRSPEAILLVLTGMAVTASGAALALGPRLSWKLGQISEGFSQLGVQGGSLLVGGMVLVALGMVRRGLALVLSEPQQRSDTDFAIDQVAADLTDVRAAMLGYSDQIRSIREVLKRFHNELQATPERVQSRLSNESAPAPDALFQMAASLDKLWARIDQRMGSQYESVQSSLARMQSAIDESSEIVGRMQDNALPVSGPVELEMTDSDLGLNEVPMGGQDGSLSMLDQLEGALPSETVEQSSALEYDAMGGPLDDPQSQMPMPGQAPMSAPQYEAMGLPEMPGMMPPAMDAPAAQPPVHPGQGYAQQSPPAMQQSPPAMQQPPAALSDEEVQNALRNMRRHGNA